MLMVFYIPGFNYKGLKVYIYIKYKLYLVNNLKTNILIDNKVFYIENFLINLINISIYI